MPTGYTYELLNKKQSFPEFAMSCARAFGALADMRDMPSDAPIPDQFTPSDHCRSEAQKAERELNRLKKMPTKERIACGKRLKAKAEASSVKALREIRKNNDALAAVRDEALAWNPPTEDHNGLHKFIVDQLEMSIEDEQWNRDHIVERVMMTPMDFYRDRVSELQRRASYYKEHHLQDVARAATNTAWVKALKESLTA